MKINSWKNKKVNLTKRRPRHAAEYGTEAVPTFAYPHAQFIIAQLQQHQPIRRTA
ncbi:hypothetical protein SEA_STICKER17_88 [Gordonia phage Sticker17]|nr:hypothetical protein SEA_STICKER17_88 [Gordonia phage Sticker17]WAA19622.1 hypothetical protein SEA_GALACTICEYE_88 [Gordonia phage GalacticEye]